MMKNSSIYVLTLSFILASCGGGGGGGGGSAPTTPSTPAPTVNLSADPTSVLLESTSTLTWSSTNATSCSASWTSQTGTSGSEAITITTAGNNSFSITCTGAGGSGSASVTVEGYRETDGVVVDGYISGAEVFIDEDDDWMLDSNENSTTSDNEGKFTIRYANGNLVSIGGTDLDSQTLLDNLLITHKLAGHTDFKAVTPVTSVAAFMEDASLVNAALGIDSSIDVSTFDPVANKGDGGINDYLYEKGNQLTVLAFALQNITNNLNTTTETTQDYFKAITEEIEKEYTETETKVDIETQAFVTKALENVIEAKSVTINETAKANVAKVLSGMLPIIQVKSSDDLTTGIIRFAISTMQTDIQAIANGTATAETVSSYTEDLLNYIAEDQSIDSGKIAPDINAIADNVTTSEDTEVEINVLLNDSYVTSSPFSLSATNGTNGTTSVSNNLITYTPDADYNGSDSFSYTLTQGDKTSSADVTITIEPVNDAPSLDIASTIQVEENQTAVTTVSVSDVDEDELTLTLGGTDADSFNLSDENVLTFKEAPDYETKATYAITLSLTDGIEAVTKDVTISITNVNDIAPEFTSDATFSAAENQTAIGTVTATDAEGDEVTFTVSGDELAITSVGVLTFVSAPDYETKTTYTATVTASDGTNTITQDITVNVTDVDDDPIDTDPPEVTSFTITPSSVDVTSESATVTLSANVTDNIGVTTASNYRIYLPTSDANTWITGTFSLASGTAQDGTWTADVTIPTTTGAGEYVVLLTGGFFDEAGNYGVNTDGSRSLTIVSNSGVDTDPPEVTSFTITPSSVDVTSESATVTLSANVTDNIGVTTASNYRIYLPTSDANTWITGTFSLASGTAQDGTWTADVTIPTTTGAGEYVVLLTGGFFDEAGNYGVNTDGSRSLTIVNNNTAGSNIYYLYGDSSQSTYLGCYGCGSSNAESICNESGTYGSSVGVSSIWNTVGTYGSTVGTNSPWNSVGTNPPEFFNNKEKTSSYGKFTINTATANRTNITKLTNILDFFNNSNDNHSATRNYACSTSETSINVTVAPNNNGSGNVYVINGEQKPSLTLERGKSYTFVHPSGHPLRFSQTADGTHGFGSEYTSDVAKSSGSTTIAVGSSTPSTLYYYCSIHSGMGGSITIN